MAPQYVLQGGSVLGRGELHGQRSGRGLRPRERCRRPRCWIVGSQLGAGRAGMGRAWAERDRHLPGEERGQPPARRPASQPQPQASDGAAGRGGDVGMGLRGTALSGTGGNTMSGASEPRAADTAASRPDDDTRGAKPENKTGKNWGLGRQEVRQLGRVSPARRTVSRREQRSVGPGPGEELGQGRQRWSPGPFGAWAGMLAGCLARHMQRQALACEIPSGLWRGRSS